jgi:4-amino-4-deoxy-L-arabinose transferase-like glycosyltransferase
MGDMVRDGGWDAAKLVRGEIENIFGYGRYQSHGYTVNKFIIPFYWIYGASDMAFKIPSALISIFDIMLVLYIGEKFFKKGTGYLAALVLIGTHLHLFYARTEIVVMFANIFTTLILLCLLSIYHNYSIRKVLIYALLIGVSLNFYSSIKPVAFISMLIVGVLILRKFFSHKNISILLATFLGIIVFIVWDLDHAYTIHPQKYF